jgi:hypothetical protein
MNRRNFLSKGAVLGISVPLIATKALVDATREKKNPVEPVVSGQVLTAHYINELAARINDLENRV